MDTAQVHVATINITLHIISRADPFIALIFALGVWAALDYVNSNISHRKGVI